MSNVMQGSDILPEVRALVKDALMKNPRFTTMPDAERRDLASDTVTALAYILGGENGDSHPASVTLADPPALPGNPQQHVQDDYRKAMKEEVGESAGERFKKTGAVAAQQGTDALAGIISRVDFPKFV